jgi:hypothetical protein
MRIRELVWSLFLGDGEAFLLTFQMSERGCARTRGAAEHYIALELLCLLEGSKSARSGELARKRNLRPPHATVGASRETLHRSALAKDGGVPVCKSGNAIGAQVELSLSFALGTMHDREAKALQLQLRALRCKMYSFIDHEAKATSQR